MPVRGRYQVTSLKISYTAPMKEQYMGSAELTHSQPYSTLNRVHSLRNGIILMPEQPPEQKRAQIPIGPEPNRVRPVTNPEPWEQDMMDQVRTISQLIKEDPGFNKDPEAYLKLAVQNMERLDAENKAKAQRTDLVEGVAGRWNLRPDVLSMRNLDEADEEIPGGDEGPAEPWSMEEETRAPRRRQDPVETAAFTLRAKLNSEKFKELRDQINQFSQRIKTEGIDTVEYNRLYVEIDGLKKADILKEGMQGEEMRTTLGMALSRIMRESPAENQEALDTFGSSVREIVDLGEGEEKYNQLENLVKQLPINDQRMYGVLLERLVNEAVESGQNSTVEFVLEYAMERFFAGLDVDPQRQMESLNFVQQQNQDAVLDIAKLYSEDRKSPKDKSLYVYLSELKNKRQIVHELYRQMNDPERFKGGVADFLRKEGLQFVESRIAGIPLVQRYYDRALGSKLSLQDGWMNTDQFEEVNTEVREMLAAQSATGMLKKDVYVKGEVKPRNMRQWEIDRAASMGEAMVALSQRRLVYTVMGDVPKGDPDEYLKSVDQELIARTLAMLKLIPVRFFDQPVAQHMLREYLDTSKKILAKDNSRRYGIGENGLYGKKEDSMAVLDSGVVDLKSNGWRSHWIFLDQEKYGTQKDETQMDEQGNKKQLSFRQYYKNVKEKAEHDLHIHTHHGHMDPVDKERWKKKVNEEMGPAIADQRLFLGTIMRYEDMDSKNQGIMWEKVVQLMPSRIAAFLPKDTLDIVDQEFKLGKDRKKIEKQWKEIAKKLWRLEDLRVESDAKTVRDYGSDPQGHLEYKGKTILDYMPKYEDEDRIPPEKQIIFNDQERKVIQKLIELGKTSTNDLIKTKFIYTAFLDDVPETGWDRLGGQDMARMLGDQSAQAEALSAIGGLYANPAIKTDKVVGIFHAYFEKISGPAGISTAQKKAEPHINAWLAMVDMNGYGKWFDIGDFTRKPRSKVEEYNLQSGVALDEDAKFKFLHALAQQEIINDDTTEKEPNGKTAFQRMCKEQNVEFQDRFWASLRMLLIIFPPMLIIQMIKGMAR